MAELSKIVQQRLARQASGGNAPHLDANLLAAFAEHALMAREREAVSAHLAQCADCRESVALAMTAQPVGEPAADRAIPAAKFHWFAQWRWVSAAAACCVLAVALQVQVQPPGLPPVEKKIRLSTPPPAAPPARAETSMQAARQPAAISTLKVERAGSELASAPKMAQAEEQKPPVEMLKGSVPESNSAAAISRPLEPPAPAAALLPSAPGRESFRAETAEAAQAKKEVAAAQAPRPREDVFVQGLAARAPVPSARAISSHSKPFVLWSINRSPDTVENVRGVLERSTDAGKTWDVVPLSDRVSFRAVASSGPDVWTGGTGGALFHSPDAGAHWERITVFDQNYSLAGTIVKIDVTSPNSITIATSSGERWTSPDGGRQWTRQ